MYVACGHVFVARYHGKNRKYQTGESDFVGFRTTGPASLFLLNFETLPNDFIPTSEVAVPNKPTARNGVATSADRHYPYCEPSSRENTCVKYDCFNYHRSTLSSNAMSFMMESISRKYFLCFGLLILSLLQIPRLLPLASWLSPKRQ